MRFPCEYVSSIFLPGLRIRVAHRLRDKGLSQNSMAKFLGVKQPVIVSYLQKKITDTGDKKVNHHLDDLSLKISNMILAQEELDDIMRSVCTKCKALRVKGPLCSIHKNTLPELQKYRDCDICQGYDGLPSLKERTEILQNLKETLSILESSDIFYNWVPEIGSQLANCDENAKDLDDVASFPGRIIKVKDAITSVSLPEFGSSKTMSSLLLWSRKIQPNNEWILSIKNKPELINKLNKLGIEYIETEELDIKWEEKLSELRNKTNVSKIKMILDKGSAGYESITYLFSRNKSELLELLKQINAL